MYWLTALVLPCWEKSGVSAERFVWTWSYCILHVCGHEVIWKTGAGPPEGHHWTLAGSSSVCLQSKRVCWRCSQHGTALWSATSGQTRGLSSAFNTIIPDTLQNKLTQLSVPTSICLWINSFMTERQQLVRLGNSHPAPARSALELLRAVFSPHCSSPCTRTTSHLKTPPSSSWSVQTTPHWSTSSRTETSLLTDRRLKSRLSGAV